MNSYNHSSYCILIFLNRPTIEIGRYQSHVEKTQDRFIGYQVKPENCEPIGDERNECWHLKLEEYFQNGSRLNAFQLGMYFIYLHWMSTRDYLQLLLVIHRQFWSIKISNISDNDDGESYKTLIVGRSAHETTEMKFNDTTNVTTKFLMTARIHKDRYIE